MSRTEEQLRILAFESFDAGSHRAVREAISRHSRHCWTWITRPGRSWKWRMRTAAIEMIELAHQRGVLHQLVTGEAGRNDLEPQYDAIFLTSLMSAADLRALLPPPLREQAARTRIFAPAPRYRVEAADTIDRLHAAIERRQVLRMDYSDG
jgi:hypothetical protein